MKSNSLVVLLLVCVLKVNGLPLDSRIVDGSNALPGQFPYQVLVRSSTNYMCGGTLLNEYWVLTAAHCLDYNAQYVVYAGSVIYEQGLQVPVRQIFLHDDPTRYDIAMMHMATPIPFSDTIKPANLPTVAGVDDSLMIMSGWGAAYDGSPVPTPDLQMTTVRKLSDAECAGYGVDASRLCTLAYNLGGACFGDSGGPVAQRSLADGSYTVHGVISHIFSATCDKGPPTMSMAVYYYVDWIRRIQAENPN